MLNISNLKKYFTAIFRKTILFSNINIVLILCLHSDENSEYKTT